MRRANSWYHGTAEYLKASNIFKSRFHSGIERVTPSQGITVAESFTLPVSMPISELMILKVDAGRYALSRYLSRLYTVNSPVILSNMANVPSTFLCLKYFERLPSSVMLFTEHAPKRHITTMAESSCRILKICAKLKSNLHDKR